MRISFCKPFDNLMNGGLESGCITNFYGPPGTAKTQIAMQAAISIANMGKKILFIDTEGGFSVERLQQMTKDNILNNIMIMEPKEWSDQKDVIKRLEELLAKEDVGLIIVDSIIALWRLSITEENASEINRELATQLSILSNIARKFDVPVLITNQVYSDIETGETQMSCKTIMKWWSKNIIELESLGPGSRKATIRKARSLPEEESVEFKITQSGLE